MTNVHFYDEVLTLQEAAIFLKVDPAIILVLLGNGSLSGLRVAEDDWRISREHLRDLVTGMRPAAVLKNEEPAAALIKIGAMVREAFDRLLANCMIPADELRRLQNPSYCKSTLGLNFPALRHVTPGAALPCQRRVGKHSRYWNQLFPGNYLVTSEWYEWQREGFLAWVVRFQEKTNEQV